MNYELKAYEIKNHFLQVGEGLMGISAVLYEPVNPDERAHTAVMCIHSDSNYLAFTPCPELAARGFTVMAANTTEPKQPLERKLLELKKCVEYLKNMDGIERVVLLGHSGGATLMSCYQAVAENGCGIFQDEEKIVKMPDIGELPAADAVMFLDSNWGNGVMTLLSIDPQVTDETSTQNFDTSYDLFDPANGFDPAGSHYSPEFRARYQKAQAARFDRIIDSALERKALIDKGEGRFIGDEPFIVPAGAQPAPNNRMFPQDISLLCRTKKEYPLLHADGSVTTEVIRSLRPPKFTRSMSRMYGMATDVSTVNTYLSGSSVRTKDFSYDECEVKGIQWNSSYCCTPGNVQHIAAPMLIMGMTGGYEFLAAEVICENAKKTTDKTVMFVEGATHNFSPEHATEKTPGEYGDTVYNCFNYVAEWLCEKVVEE